MALRSASEVQALLHQANVNEEDLRPETQVLHFSSDFLPEQDTVVLLELNAELLNIFKEGQSAVLRGDPLESVVLCTNDKTFQVREAVTSNSMLLVPEVGIPSESPGEKTLVHREVSSLHHTYLEVTSCVPHYHKLRHLLEECPYRGHDEQHHKSGHRYSLNDLLDRVQCSEEELDAGLKSLEAFHIYGFWQIPEHDYLFKIVSHITNLVSQREWSLDSIPYEEALQELSKLEPRTVMAQCLDYYMQPTHIEREDGNSLYALKGDKVCRLFGEVILRATSGINIEEFNAMWTNSVPEGLQTSLGQLEGLILLDKSPLTTVITYFTSADLPLDAKTRFKTLFDERERWTYEEICPFLDDIADNKNPVSSLLMKHTRVSIKDDIKYYIRKYAK